MALLHLLTNHNYGLHRDELQVLSDARHLDWGFVAYPPLTPFVERIGLGIFGVSPVGLRRLRGDPVPPPSTLIVLGFSRASADRAFTSCRVAGHNGNPDGVKNEESEDHPDIFVCGGPRLGWAEFWKEYQAFG